MNINRNNKRYDMIKSIREQRRKLINFWMHTGKTTREMWHKKRPPSAKTQDEIKRGPTRSNHRPHRNTTHLNMVNLNDQPSHQATPHHFCQATQQDHTPPFINRLQLALAPAIAAIQATPNTDRNITHSEQPHTRGQTAASISTTPPSPADLQEQHANNDEDSVDFSLATSDFTENIIALRSELEATTIGQVTPSANREDAHSLAPNNNNKKSKKPKRRSKHTRCRSKHKAPSSRDGGDGNSSSSFSSAEKGLRK
jgi:hypothetical protein